MVLVGVIGRIDQGDESGFGERVQFADLLTKPGKGHVVQLVVGDDQGRCTSSSGLKCSWAILKPTNLKAFRSGDLFDQSSDGGAAIYDKNRRRHGTRSIVLGFLRS